MEMWFNGTPLHRVDEAYFVPATDLGAPGKVTAQIWTATDAEWLAENGIG